MAHWRYYQRDGGLLLAFALPAFAARTFRFQFLVGDAQLCFLRLVKPATEPGFFRANYAIGVNVTRDIYCRLFSRRQMLSRAVAIAVVIHLQITGAGACVG